MQRTLNISRLQPVVKQSIESQATAVLRDFLLSGAVEPGARLTEIALADQLGIARATLRTALHRLAGEGILVQIPYTGWQVAALSETDVWELWTLRASLESLATRLVTLNATDADRHEIGRAFEALVAACAEPDLKRVNDCDFSLHRCIVSAARHVRLARQYDLVEHQIRLFIATCNASLCGTMNEIVTQHQPIVLAILRGDAARAAEEAWRHNESEGARLAAWLRNQSAV